MYSRRTNRYQRRTSSTRLAPPTRTLPPEMVRRIETDPSFQVMTADRQQWIDPYTGRSVPASLGRIQAAREYLLENEQIWKNGQPTLPVPRLEYERWRLDLIQLLPNEPRLRIFGRDGAWLNPFTGEFAPDVQRDDGRISLKTVSRIAKQLCLTPTARNGSMLELQAMLSKVRNAPLKPVAAPIDEAMQKASNVQRKLLRDLPVLDGFALAVHYRAHHGVSGDFYDVTTLPDGRILIVLGDVSGHGMQAALVVATALKTLRYVAREEGELRDVLARFNDEIKIDLIPGQFITLFAATLDQVTGEFVIIRAGHHPGLLVNLASETMVRRVGKSGMAIGLATGALFADTLREERLTLVPGDVLVQYTDGLVEASDSDERPFGESRLCASVLNHIEDSPQILVDAIAEEVSRWAGGPVGDDITLLTVFATRPSSADTTPLGTPIVAEASDTAGTAGVAETAGDLSPSDGERLTRESAIEGRQAPPPGPMAGAGPRGADPVPAVSDEAGGDQVSPSETGELETPVTP